MTSRLAWEKLLTNSELPDLVQGLDTVIQILTISQETKYAWRMKRWARDLYFHVVRSSPKLAIRMRTAKEYFSLCRLKAIRGEWGKSWGSAPAVPLRARDETADKRRILHQISRVSRSLREADLEVVEDSLRQHAELASTAFETPEHLRQSFADHCASCFGGPSSGVLGSVGPSSSFLRTKAAGGAPVEIREITDNFKQRLLSSLEIGEVARSIQSLGLNQFKIINTEYLRSYGAFEGKSRATGLHGVRCLAQGCFFPYDKSYECDLEDWDDQRDILFSIVACWLAIDLSQLPKCRQVAVKERGWKVRVATPLESPFRYLLGVINSALLEGMEKCPQMVSALHGRPAEKLDWSQGRRTNLVFSADLKAATDHFPHDLMSDAAEAISKDWPDTWQDLFMRAVGPHHLYASDRSWRIETKRGILMGSPVSWPLLSAYSTWIHSLSGSNGWFAVCGDDYIGCHTYDTYTKYKRFRTLTGAVGSPGKDILGRQSVGVFAEELVTVGRCRWIPTVSVRAVLADSKSGQPSWSQGPEVSAALDVLNWTPTQKGIVCSRLHKSAYRTLRRLNIDPVGPRWLGCAGFPGIPSQTTMRRGRILASQSRLLVVDWMTRLEIAWSTAPHCPSIRNRVTKELYESTDYLSCCPSERVGEWGPLRDVVSSRIGQLSWAYYLSGAIVTLRPRPSLAQTSRAIIKVRQEIDLRGRWLPPDEKIVSGEGICRRLQELEPFSRPIPFRATTLRIALRMLGGTSRPAKRKSPSGPGSPHWGDRKRSRQL